MTVMVLGGLWHGASWTFVLWGAFHGSILIAYRALGIDERLSVIAVAPGSTLRIGDKIVGYQIETETPRTVGELRWVVAIFFNRFCACARPPRAGIRTISSPVTILATSSPAWPAMARAVVG